MLPWEVYTMQISMQAIREIPRLVMGDKAVNTVKKYSGAVRRWATWAKSHGFEPFPAMPHAVAIYVVFFVQTT